MVKSSRKEELLCGCRQVFEKCFQVRPIVHVKNKICFITHKLNDVLEGYLAILDEVHN